MTGNKKLSGSWTISRIMVIRNYLRGLPKLLYITKMVAKDGVTQTETVSTHSAIVYPHPFFYENRFVI